MPPGSWRAATDSAAIRPAISSPSPGCATSSMVGKTAQQVPLALAADDLTGGPADRTVCSGFERGKAAQETAGYDDRGDPVLGHPRRCGPHRRGRAGFGISALLACEGLLTAGGRGRVPFGYLANF